MGTGSSKNEKKKYQSDSSFDDSFEDGEDGRLLNSNTILEKMRIYRKGILIDEKDRMKSKDFVG